MICTLSFCSATKTRFHFSWFLISVKSFCTSKQGKVRSKRQSVHHSFYQTDGPTKRYGTKWNDFVLLSTTWESTPSVLEPAEKILQNAFERRHLRVNIYSTSNGGKRNFNIVMETFHWHPPKTYFPKEKKLVWGRVQLVTAVRCGSSRRSIVS